MRKNIIGVMLVLVLISAVGCVQKDVTYCAQDNPSKVCEGLSEGDRAPSCDTCNICTCSRSPDGSLVAGCTEMAC